MKYEVTFLISYTIDDAINEWDAIEQANDMFDCDTHFNYDISVNPISEED